MSGQHSPLGRYAEDVDETDQLVEVVLLSTPLELLVRSREHHDGLLREFRLLALSGRADTPAVPARLAELTEVLGSRYGAARSRLDGEVDEALARGVQVLDLRYTVPRSVVGAVTTVDSLMAEADAFCASQQLMTTERPPLMKQFASWYLEQFVLQCAGAAPTPWDGPTTLPPE